MRRTQTLTFIVTAGGSGTRMQADLPKQFIVINEEVVLMRTLRVFYEYCKEALLILVLPQAQISYWEDLCIFHEFTIPHKIVAGGDTRYQSVKNGLSGAPEEGIIAIHDGVRPLVDASVIAQCVDKAKCYGAAIPVIPVVDSMRMLTDEGSEMVDRQAFRCVQTPQAFDALRIKQAYEQPWEPGFTDDASVYEKTFGNVCLTEGSKKNIKLTHPEDLELAKAWW